MFEAFEHKRAWLGALEAATIAGEFLHGTDHTPALAWEQPTVRMFGKVTPVPRLTYTCGRAYGYSGIRHAAAPWTPRLDALRYRLEHTLGAMFNSCLVNLYRDGRDSIGWHADDEPELGKDPVIASLSLGSARTFALRHNVTRERRNLELASGDLVVMRGDAQREYQHSVPKAAGSAFRINVTFRYIVK